MQSDDQLAEKGNCLSKDNQIQPTREQPAIAKPGLLGAVTQAITDRLEYRKLARRISHAAQADPTGAAAQINADLRGYPSNHVYSVVDNDLVPCFQLFQRAKRVEPLYPARLTSLLDIGCCKGYYVLRAAQQPTCQRAIGIDIHKPFIDAGNKARDHLQINNADLRVAKLEDVQRDPAAFGGQFQTVILLGAYHYLFWGNETLNGILSHREILRGIADLCTDRLIISARFELDTLPRRLRYKPGNLRAAAASYSSEGFLKEASEFFDARLGGYLGKYSLFVLTRKK